MPRQYTGGHEELADPPGALPRLLPRGARVCRHAVPTLRAGEIVPAPSRCAPHREGSGRAWLPRLLVRVLHAQLHRKGALGAVRVRNVGGPGRRHRPWVPAPDAEGEAGVLQVHEVAEVMARAQLQHGERSEDRRTVPSCRNGRRSTVAFASARPAAPPRLKA